MGNEINTSLLPSRRREDLLEAINRDLPTHMDWKAGAENYLQQVFARDGRENVEPYLLNKPFTLLQGGPDHESRATFLDLVHNFTNVLQLLRLPMGARILDVACGAGWVSQWLMRLGFEVVGIDMCSDLLLYARRRLSEDPLLLLSEDKLRQTLVQHDIEAEQLPDSLGQFDAAIFESCLHHFYDPISALMHTAKALKDDGLAVLIEGENRRGPIKSEYVDVMRQFATLERPYQRSELVEALTFAGLPCVEFFGAINGWYSPSAPASSALPEFAKLLSQESNRAVCAKAPAALQRILPWWQPVDSRSVIARHGFSAASPGLAWSGPHSEMYAQSYCERLIIQIGSHLPNRDGQPQHVSLSMSSGVKHEILLTPQVGSATIELSGVAAGTEIHCTSNAVFSPAWEGEQDSRVLSFWLSARDGSGRLLIPTE